MSRTAPRGARHEWPYDQGQYPEQADRRGGQGPGYGDPRGTQDSGYGDRPGALGAGSADPRAQRPRHGDPRAAQSPGYDPRAAQRPEYGDAGYGDPRTGQAPGYPAQGYGGRQGTPALDGRDPWRGPAQYGDRRSGQRQGYGGNGQGRPAPGYGDAQGYGDGQGYGDAQGYANGQRYASGRGQGYGDGHRYANGQGYGDAQGYGDGYDDEPGTGPGGPGKGTGIRRGLRNGSGRLRGLMRLRTVRAIAVLLLVFFVWLSFSVGQALTAPYGGSTASRLAEWARGHYLGVFVTLGEWLTYSPPKVGGKPGFSLAVPAGESAAGGKHGKFKPDIPATLKSLAGSPLTGEGQWRVVEKVKGEPAIFSTFLRDATYTSYVNGVVSMDQRLVSFQLHPGGQDPGGSGWGPNTQPWIPPGSRTGLLATFNGGFKLDASQGGFYLNGKSKGTLQKGAASVVYYKNGTVKIGQWGRDFTMTSKVTGVRQNLKLIVDHGQIAPNLNQNIESAFGATLGGGYFVWRSGLGITRDGRLIYVYGPALNVQDLAQLLQRAGAVEGMQMDINPEWMSYMYYQAKGHASDPRPVNLLPTQQASAYRYYSPYSRDFTAVYAR